MAKRKKKAYELREGLRERPVRIIHNGEWVGVGGAVTLKARPPKVPVVIREATDAEYLEIAERNPYLVTKL